MKYLFFAGLVALAAAKPAPVPGEVKADSQGCGSNYPHLFETAGTGRFSSPNHPDDYPNNANCGWRMNMTDAVVELAFNPFNIESSSTCSYDWVEVFDGPDRTSPSLGKFCGSTAPNVIRSSSSMMFVEFRSDSSITRSGFMASWKSYTPPPTCPPNTFTCGSGECISLKERCNNVTACADGSDERNCECGQPAIEPVMSTIRVVGGVEATPHSWPWQVQVKKYGSHYCGAMLIDPQWILSAAHCFYGGSISSYQMRLGSHKQSVDDEGELNPALEAMFVHEQYAGSVAGGGDIALIKLREPVELSDTINTACIPDVPPPVGHMCYVTGWGSTKNTGSNSVLRQVNVPVVTNAECKSWYGGYGSSIKDDMVCLGYQSGGKDTCQGDSGGPVSCKIDGKWEVHGTTSWGVGCAEANHPGVYTRIAYYKDWIQRTMRDNA